jgi:hypothetical protein
MAVAAGDLALMLALLPHRDRDASSSSAKCQPLQDLPASPW